MADNEFGKTLKQRRLLIPLTLRELAAKSGVSESHLARIERGDCFSSAHILHKIAKPLGFEEDKLLTLAGYLSPQASTESETATGRLDPIVLFLKDVMSRRNRLRSQLAADLGVSHTTVSRWLSGEDIPNTRSCRKLAEYTGVPLEKVFSIAGYLPRIHAGGPPEWPEFGEYARRKYPNELDEDLVTVLEILIERRRQREA